MDIIVSAVYLPQYYLHILTTNFTRCVACWVLWKFQNLNVCNFFKFSPLTLSCVHVTWMWKVDSSSVLLLQQLLIFHEDTSRWFNKHMFRPTLQILFLTIFSIDRGSDIKDNVDPIFAVTLNGWKFGMLMCSDHLEKLLDFDILLLIFLIFSTFWLSETGQICDFRAFS